MIKELDAWEVVFIWDPRIFYEVQLYEAVNTEQCSSTFFVQMSYKLFEIRKT